MITMEGTNVRYGPRLALRDIDLSLSPGVIALLGPNGAGKTTLFKTLLGLVKPSSGQVRVSGVDPHRNARKLMGRTGWVPQDARPAQGLSCRDVVTYAGWLKGINWQDASTQTTAALDSVDLGGRADDRVRTLSGGMQRRVVLACAMVHTPSLLLLDEPLNGLDPGQRIEMRKLVKAYAEAHDACVVLSTHVVADLPGLADRILVLSEGELIVDRDADGDVAALEDLYRSATARRSG